MSRLRRKAEGVIAVEACLCLTLFMFFVLFLYSFFSIYEAQSKIQHTLLQAAQSMSLDALAIEKLGTGNSSLYEVAEVIGFNALNKNPDFVETTAWYKYNNAAVADTGEDRFVAYLAEGDRELADQILKSYNIKNGLAGLDFSSSKKDDKGNIVLTVNYTVEYFFDFKAFGMNPLELTNSVTSRLWEWK